MRQRREQTLNTHNHNHNLTASAQTEGRDWHAEAGIALADEGRNRPHGSAPKLGMAVVTFS